VVWCTPSSQLVGDLPTRPRLLGQAISQIRLQAGEAELGGALGAALVGAVALMGAVGRPWERRTLGWSCRWRCWGR
jgi:hypothetical protein